MKLLKYFFISLATITIVWITVFGIFFWDNEPEVVKPTQIEESLPIPERFLND
jgi:hypothetical protein|tara:strand:+ start:381 stop:539 length:159 start_codon:yes stop_codon:yes gene_type:complete